LPVSKRNLDLNIILMIIIYQTKLPSWLPPNFTLLRTLTNKQYEGALDLIWIKVKCKKCIIDTTYANPICELLYDVGREEIA
jgi:hypothetical protein